MWFVKTLIQTHAAPWLPFWRFSEETTRRCRCFVILRNHKTTKKFAKSLDVLFRWPFYLVGYLVGRVLRDRVFIEDNTKCWRNGEPFILGRIIRLAFLFGWPWVSVDLFSRLAVLFSWPLYSVGRLIRLAILFCRRVIRLAFFIRLAVLHVIGRVIRLAVLFGWPFYSVGHLFRWAVLFCGPFYSVRFVLRLRVLFGWPFYTVSHFIRLVVLFGLLFHSVNRFIRLAVWLSWPFYSVSHFILLAVLFGWRVCRKVGHVGL